MHHRSCVVRDLVCPDNCIADANSGRLRSSPKFEVLWSVVVVDSVPMIHGFTVQQIPPKKSLCHENLFNHLQGGLGGRSGAGIFETWCRTDNVGLVRSTLTFIPLTS